MADHEPAPSGVEVKFGPYALDLWTKIAKRDHKEERLTTTEAILFRRLIEAQGGIVTVFELLKTVAEFRKRPASSYTENYIHVSIKRLIKKIERISPPGEGVIAHRAAWSLRAVAPSS